MNHATLDILNKSILNAIPDGFGYVLFIAPMGHQTSVTCVGNLSEQSVRDLLKCPNDLLFHKHHE